MKVSRKVLVYCLLIMVFGLICQPAFASAKIDLNTATVAQLVELKGIGEKTAEKIVKYRKEHKFTSVDELVNVKGVGSKTLDKIRDQITVKKKKK
ncbi:MAG: helix-hairpin-helix domain-containing protein [Desulfuromusa sp.]